MMCGGRGFAPARRLFAPAFALFPPAFRRPGFSRLPGTFRARFRSFPARFSAAGVFAPARDISRPLSLFSRPLFGGRSFRACLGAFRGRFGSFRARFRSFPARFSAAGVFAPARGIFAPALALFAPAFRGPGFSRLPGGFSRPLHPVSNPPPQAQTEKTGRPPGFSHSIISFCGPRTGSSLFG